MSIRDPSILIVGAGAVGGITAVLLKKNGYDVTIVAKHSRYAEKIITEGISVSGAAGTFTEVVPAVTSMAEVNEKKNIVFLAVKANDLGNAAKEALPLLADGGYMVSMQNGICEYELASIAGKERTVGCVVGWGATMSSPGILEMTSKGDFLIGYFDRKPDEDLNRLAEIMGSVAPARATSNIVGHRYSKLIINSCITSPGAACGLYLGQMLSIARMRNIFIKIIREAVAVANAMNITIEVFGGKLDFYKFIEKEGWLADFKRDVMIRVIGFKYRRLKSSSLQSLERGKQTEISYLNGFIADTAEKFNIPVPVNRKITEIVKMIEQGHLSIGIDNFDDPLFD